MSDAPIDVDALEETEQQRRDDDDDDDDDDDVTTERSALRKSSPSLIMDYRIMWIRDRALRFLGLQDKFELFDNLINENDRCLEDKLLNFLILDMYGVTDLDRKQVFFYKTSHKEVRQEEVAVWEERKAGMAKEEERRAGEDRRERRAKRGKRARGKGDKADASSSAGASIVTESSTILHDPPRETSIQGSIGERPVRDQSDHGRENEMEEEVEEEEEEEEEDEDGDESRVVSSFAKVHWRHRTRSDASVREAVPALVPPPGEEDRYVLTKRVIERVVEVPDLHMFCGEVDGNRSVLQNINLVYFMRTSEEGIRSFDTYRECEAEITDYLVVGSLNGRFLFAFHKMLTQVFKPLVEKQFREPIVLSRHRKGADVDGDGDGDNDSDDDDDDDDDDDSDDDDDDDNDNWTLHLDATRGATAAVQSMSGRLSRTVRRISGQMSTVTASQTAAFTRPSDYRRMSMSASRVVFADQSLSRKREGGTFDRRSKALVRSERARRKRSFLRDGKGDGGSVQPARPLNNSVGGTQRKSEAEVEPSKNNVQEYLAKLTSSVAWTLEHTEGDILLTIPKIPELTDPCVTDKAFCANKGAIEELEEVVMSWGRHIQKVLDSYVNKVPRGKGPMAEYDYWHDREIGLSVLVEQLKVPSIKRILALLNQALSAIASGFDYYQMELWKHYVEARDNNKFLFTMLRHFKTIEDSDSFKTIAETISLLMEGMKMIWVLSKYYCTEDKMVPLLERIAWQLVGNATKNLAVDRLFRKSLDQVLRDTREACTTMRSWKQAYLNTRERIEISGKSARWEFDQRRLFKDTEYIADVCDDLNKVASILEDFYNIFGPDLKAIVNDPAQIDAVVKRVDRLIVPIQEADFNVFDEFNKENWEATMTQFYAEVAFLENEAKSFIDECFMVLISAEEALELLLKFKNIKTRAAIQEQLLRKFDVIVQQLSKEIGLVEDIFNRGKRNPPLLRYHPPVAGAIYWQRQLFQRLKRPVLTLQGVDELRDSESKLMAFERYLSIAKQMRHFEGSKFDCWIDGARSVVANTLKKRLLKVVPCDREKRAAERAERETRVQSRGYPVTVRTKGGSKTCTAMTLQESCQRQAPFSGSRQRNPEVTASRQSFADTSGSGIGSKVVPIMVVPGFEGRAKRLVGVDATSSGDRAAGNGLKDRNVVTPSISTTSERQGGHAAGQSLALKVPAQQQGAILAEYKMRFELNFDWDVFDVIGEAELLEHMGFELPLVVRDIGIQKDRLQADIEATSKMIGQFNAITDAMDIASIRLLRRTLQRIERHIQPGITRLNWYSLGIADYAVACGRLLKELSSTVAQVNQMKKDLDERIETDIESYNLISTTEDRGEAARGGGLLGCKPYFIDVERKRTELICAMLKTYRSASPMLMKLESLVEGTSTGKSASMQLYYEQYESKIFAACITCFARNLDTLNKLLAGNTAVFQIDAVLVSSEVVLRPSPGEIYTIILHDVKDLLERTKAFPRWMNGTCIECKPTRQEQSDEFATFSYFEDIMSVQVINDLILTVQDTAHKLAIESSRYLQRWRKYGNLWHFDKNQSCEKFAAKGPTLLQYDDKFTFYGAILQEVEEMTPYCDINSFRVNLVPLLEGIREHAKEWRQVLANYLLADTLRSMSDFRTKLESLRSDVELVITGLDRFKLVMQTIADIKKMAVQAEVRYRSYQETFRTLRAHEIDFADEDEEMAYRLQREWESLYLGALYRGTTLESTKDRFSEMTREQIADFARELVEFADDFEKRGPGSVGNDLDAGMRMMDEYGKLIEALESKRLDLVNAEILFDLPPADYSPFLKVKKDYEGMEVLYKLYKAQRTARDAWSKTLWANLNPQQLIDGMEQLIKEFRRLPRAIRLLNVGQALENTMKSFKNSVPLFVELKNEAMRERHWLELMDKTGQHFDMSADRFDDQQL